MNTTQLMQYWQHDAAYCREILLALFVLLIALWQWQRARRAGFENQLRSQFGTLRSVINKGEALSKLLLDDADRFVHAPVPFIGETKSTLDASRSLWAKWLACRKALIEAEEQGQLHLQAYLKQPQWKLSRREGLRAAAAISTRELQLNATHLASSEALLPYLPTERFTAARLAEICSSEQDLVQQQYLYFQNGLSAVAQTIAKIEDELGAASAEKEDGMRHLMQELSKLGLSLAPYQKRFAEIDSLKQSYCQTLRVDPFKDSQASHTSLCKKIKLLKAKLRKAISCNAVLLKRQSEQAAVQALLRDRKSQKPQSAVPGISFQENCRFAEAGFELDLQLADCQAQLNEAAKALKEGRLLKFARIESKVPRAFKAIEAKLEKLDADKQNTEAALALLETESTEPDRAADAGEREEICKLYSEQSWNAAAKASSLLLSLHEKRKALRVKAEEISGVLESLHAQLVREDANLTAAPISCYHELAAVCRELCRRSALGREDWAELSAKFEELNSAVQGESHRSLKGLIEAELQIYRDSLARISRAGHDLNFVQSKILEGWGSPDLGSRLAPISASAEALTKAALKRKADWKSLLESADALIAELAPLLKEIEEELARAALIEESLLRSEKVIAELSSGELLGLQYGVFCPSSQFVQPLSEARKILAEKRYAEAEQAAKTLHVAVAREYLEAVWLLLQLMHQSNGAAAEQYAQEQGYADGCFESWAAGKLAQSSGDYLLPRFLSEEQDCKKFLVMEPFFKLPAPEHGDYNTSA
ncbi:MAG: hypothetical protein K2X27_05735 [Candidatus Obscuribacterales bacterium]|nr:hypothetical protein [Candidatus Obscuribacterales bacterium]